eukprot:5368131-Pyramimonas_sp.AAC.1
MPGAHLHVGKSELGGSRQEMIDAFAPIALNAASFCIWGHRSVRLPLCAHCHHRRPLEGESADLL